jgi:hypothetical protein
MPRNAILIAKEYVQPGESPQVRKNGLTALAILGGQDGWTVLIDAALTDTDTSVRDHAEDELGRLPPEDVGQAIGPLVASLSVRGKREAAYALLGRLRNRGVQFQLPPLPLTSRLSLAKAMQSRLHPTMGFLVRIRGWKGASLAIGAAWAVLMLFCGIALDLHIEIGSAIGMLLVAWLITLLVVIPATTFTSPIHCYADVAGGAALDIGMAIAAATGLAALTWVSWLQTEGGSARPWIFFIIGPLVVAAVRAGTLSVFGLLRTSWQNFVLEAAVGGMCGAAVAHLALFFSDGNNEFLNTAWYVLTLGAAGLAGAYAWIDKGSDSRRLVSRGVTAAGLLLAAVSVLLPLTLAYGHPALPDHSNGDVNAEVAFKAVASALSRAKMQERISAN